MPPYEFNERNSFSSLESMDEIGVQTTAEASITKQQQQQQQKQQQQRRRQSVSFDFDSDCFQVHRIHRIQDMMAAEIAAQWYTKQEFGRMERESRMHSMGQRQQVIREAITAVLKEQWKHRRTPPSTLFERHEQISQAYQLRTSNSVHEARKRALQEESDALEYQRHNAEQEEHYLRLLVQNYNKKSKWPKLHKILQLMTPPSRNMRRKWYLSLSARRYRDRVSNVVVERALLPL